MAEWTFLTNHAHVLLHLAFNPAARLRDVAAEVGITERATLRIVRELEAEGYVSHTRVGRRNRYVIHPERPFRHPTQRHHDIGSLIGLIGGSAAQRQAKADAEAASAGAEAAAGATAEAAS